MKLVSKFLAIYLLIPLLVFAYEKYEISGFGLENAVLSEARSINNSGQVCGTYYVDRGFKEQFIFFWCPKLGLYTIDIRSEELITKSKIVWTGQEITLPIQLNVIKLTNSGDVAFNISVTNGQDLRSFAFLWSIEGGLVEINTMVNSSNAYFLDINDNNQAIIYSGSSSKECRAYLLNVETHVMQAISGIIPLKINNNDEILGTQELKNGSKTVLRSVVRLPSGEIINNPFKQPTHPLDFNDRGSVVCMDKDDLLLWSIKDNNFKKIDQNLHLYHAVLNNNETILIGYTHLHKIWEKGNLFNLNSILNLEGDISTLWERLGTLYDMNDRGQIVGSGIINFNQRHAMLLTPVK